MWQILFCILALTAAVPDDDHDDHFESAEFRTYVKAVPGVRPIFKAAFPIVQTFPAVAEYKSPEATGNTGYIAGEYSSSADTGNTGYGTGEYKSQGEVTGYAAETPTNNAAAALADVEVTHVDSASTGSKPGLVQNSGTPFFVKVDDDDDEFKVAFASKQFRAEGDKTPIFYRKFSAEVEDDDFYKFKFNPTFRGAGIKTPVVFKRSVEVDDDVIVAPAAQFREAGRARTPVFYRKFSTEVDDDDFFRTAAIRQVPLPYTAGSFRTAGTVSLPITYSVGNYKLKFDDDDDDRKYFFRTAGTSGYRFNYDDDDDLFDHDDK